MKSCKLLALSCKPEANDAATRRRGDTATRKGYQLSAISSQPGRTSLVRRSAVTSGFTLIEMVVVVAIIALLLAISVPVSSGLLNSQKARATEAMFETVRNAIEVFQTEKPLKNHQRIFELGSHWDMFGPLPPSPTALLTWADPGDSDLWLSGPEMDAKTGLLSNDKPGIRTREKFIGKDMLIESYLQGEYRFPTTLSTQAPMKYATTECLLVFLRRFSPQARTIVDRVNKFMTNEDKDYVELLDPATGNPYSDPKREDLPELRDAWGNAVRYTVRFTGPVVGGRMYRWELRSAGADGKFGDIVDKNGIPDPFTTEAERYSGDDVVVSGSIKVEPI